MTNPSDAASEERRAKLRERVRSLQLGDPNGRESSGRAATAPPPADARRGPVTSPSPLPPPGAPESPELSPPSRDTATHATVTQVSLSLSPEATDAQKLTGPAPSVAGGSVSTRPAVASAPAARPMPAARPTAQPRGTTGGRAGSSGGLKVTVVVLALLLVALVGAVLTPLYVAYSKAQDENAALKNDLQARQAAEQAAIKERQGPAPGDILLEAKGYIIPQQQILVSPQVSGRVTELNFEAGQLVKQDDVLAVLDATEYEAEHERALAAVARAEENLAEIREGNRPEEIAQSQAELAEAKTNVEQAERVYRRKEELLAKKILTREEFEDSRSLFEAARQRVDRLSAALTLMQKGPRIERRRASEAELRQAQADLSRAKWRLDNTIIRAPISGTILKKNAELGNLVNPVAFNGSFSLCDIADLSRLEVELTIQERDLSRVFVGQQCSIRTEAWPDRVYQGQVSRLLPIADRAKGALPVRVTVKVPDNEVPGTYLKPEMGAIVVFYNKKTTGPDSSPRLDETAPKPAEIPREAQTKN